MAKAQFVPITAAVLGWAIKESGLSIEDIARPIKVQPEEVEAWARGSKQPTKGQFTHLSEVLRRPSALFFLKQPPAHSPARVGLRAAFGNLRRDLNRDEINAIRYAQGLQTLIRWSANDSEPLVGGLVHASFEMDPESVSGEFRDQLRVKPFHQRSWSDAAVAFSAWRKALEALGIVVLQFNLGPTAIRGFSIASSDVPLGAVNTSYAYQVRIFSLFHEVAHLITGSSSACVGFAAPIRRVDRIERWCDRFAAALLLPAGPVRAFLLDWHPYRPVPGLDEIRALSHEFHVSARASAMRLIDLGMAEASLYAAVDANWKPLERTEKRGGRAPSTPKRRLRQVGRRVGALIGRAVSRGSITRLDALRYLDLTVGEFDDFSELVAAEG